MTDESIFNGIFVKCIECNANNNLILNEVCWIKLTEITEVTTEGVSGSRFFTHNNSVYYIALIDPIQFIENINKNLKIWIST